MEEEVFRLRRMVSRDFSSSVNASGLNFAPSYSAVSSPLSPATEPSSVSGRIPSGRQFREPQTWTEREEVAREVGAFLARALRGEHRGNSGRERNQLASRFWIVCRSIDGELYNPPKIYRTWRAVCELVKRGTEVGDSIFVGLPSQQECSIAISVTGLRYVGQIDG